MERPEVIDIGTVATQAGDRADLVHVFHASYRRLVAQMYGVVGDLAEAEDLVQEAFVRAAAAGSRFTRVDNPEAWLRTVALNLQRNRWRKLHNFGRVRPRLAGSGSSPPPGEDHVAVISALRHLPAPQREVLALHYLADLHVSEIADVLGVPEGTVKSRLNRGRDALTALLGEESDDA